MSLNFRKFCQRRLARKDRQQYSSARRTWVGLSVEPLEDRRMLSWGAVPPAYFLPSNSGLAVLDGSTRDASGTGTIMNGGVCAGRFTAPVSGSYMIQATTPNSNLDTVLGIYNASGNRVAYNDDMAPGSNTDSRVTVNLTGGNMYYFCTSVYSGSASGSFSYYIDGPNASSGLQDDRYEENDSLGQATNLGTLDHSTARGGSVSNLVMADSQDWFRFTLAEAGRTGDYAKINFTHAQGDLDLELYNSSGQRIRYSNGIGNEERIDLNGFAAGTYYVKVFGYNGVRNPNYWLSIGLQGGGTTASSRTLYVDFDGEAISRSTLVSYANNQWQYLSAFDPDNNGVSVSSFIAGRTDREQVISQVFTLLSQDLQPFGITVQRTYSVVAGVGATTVLVGENTEPNRSTYSGIAADIDVGNDNRTDIAMARGDSSYWSLPASTLAQVMADLILHEAGHTWGLYHVNAGSAREAMSYDPGGNLGNNTSFINASYSLREFSGTQNSYAYMYRTFVSSSYGPYQVQAVSAGAAYKTIGAGAVGGGPQIAHDDSARCSSSSSGAEQDLAPADQRHGSALDAYFAGLGASAVHSTTAVSGLTQHRTELASDARSLVEGQRGHTTARLTAVDAVFARMA